MGNCWAIPVEGIVKSAKRIASSSNTAAKRRVTSRGTDQALQLEYCYTQALAQIWKHSQGDLLAILKDLTGYDYSRA